jgi:hypothetical protein
MEKLFTIGSRWETATDRDRAFLKGFIGRLVGYPCKIACKYDGEIVDVYVMSDRTASIDDWIEIHSNGAVCPSEDLYAEKRKRIRSSLNAACDAHNEEYGVEPYPDDDEDDDDSHDEKEEDEESQEKSDSSEEEEEEDESSSESDSEEQSV